MLPQLGLPVQYFSRPDETPPDSKMLGGFIAGISAEGVMLFVFDPAGIFMTSAVFSVEVLPGTWRGLPA